MEQAIAFGLGGVSIALYLGLSEIAKAIRTRSVIVQFGKPLQIETVRNADGTPS